VCYELFCTIMNYGLVAMIIVVLSKNIHNITDDHFMICTILCLPIVAHSEIRTHLTSRLCRCFTLRFEQPTVRHMQCLPLMVGSYPSTWAKHRTNTHILAAKFRL